MDALVWTRTQASRVWPLRGRPLRGGEAALDAWVRVQNLVVRALQDVRHSLSANIAQRLEEDRRWVACARAAQTVGLVRPQHGKAGTGDPQALSRPRQHLAQGLAGCLCGDIFGRV